MVAGGPVAGFAVAGACCCRVIAVGGAGGGLDHWDRAFERQLLKVWERPRRADQILLRRRKKREEEEQEAEAAAVLRMLGFMD